MKKQITVRIRKITLGEDGKTYLTLEHSSASNYPSLVLKDGKVVKDILDLEKRIGGDNDV